jgi:hypothetical protein
MVEKTSNWESAILMACRPTRRGDELRSVVALKSSSDLRKESTHHCGSATKDIRGLVDSSRKRDKGKPKLAYGHEKSWEEDANLQILTVIGRSLSGSTGNRATVPKGACGYSPKDWKHGARMRGEVYSLLN